MLTHTLPSVLGRAKTLAAATSVDTTYLFCAANPHAFDVRDRERVIIEGKDRVRFLHAMLSNDVSSLQVGQGRWATFNTVKGRTVSDVRLFVVDDDKRNGAIWALLEPGARDAFVEGLDKFVISEKVYFSDAEETALWLLAGPTADQTLAAAGATLPPDEPFAHLETTVGGRRVRVLRLDVSGRDAKDLGLWMAADDEAAVL